MDFSFCEQLENEIERVRADLRERQEAEYEEIARVLRFHPNPPLYFTEERERLKNKFFWDYQRLVELEMLRWEAGCVRVVL